MSGRARTLVAVASARRIEEKDRMVLEFAGLQMRLDDEVAGCRDEWIVKVSAQEALFIYREHL